jgi:uncharacterized membrane protein
MAHPEASATAQENIRTVAQLEESFRTRRTFFEHVADVVGSFAGSIPFVVLHLIWFLMWFLINTGRMSFIRPFDPYPCVFLALLLSGEAVLLSTFVLMKQNRMTNAADRRAHINLQIDMLAEREATKLLQMQRLICRRLGIEEVESDRELEDLLKDTHAASLADQLTRNIKTD